MKHRFFLAAILCFTILTFTTCNSADHRRLRVAALLKSSTNPFFAMMWEGIKSEADRRGIEVELFWPKGESDFAYQIDFLKNKAQDFDALIFAPSNPNEDAPLLHSLKQRNKKIVVLDEAVPIPHGKPSSEYFDTFIATDNVSGGEIAAEYAKHFLSKSSQVIIVSGFDFKKPRTMSFKKTLKARFPHLKIFEFTGEFDREKTRSIVQQQRVLFEQSSVIYCANDHMAIGVIQELLKSKHKRLPTIIGYDSIREAQEAILQGTLAASVAQFPAQMGTEGIAAVDELMHGHSVAPQLLIPPELSLRKSTVQTVNVSALSAIMKGNHD